jgi:hypothetical protein
VIKVDQSPNANIDTTQDLLSISGRIDHVELFLKEFGKLYNNEENHLLRVRLMRVPTDKEEKMIVEYVSKTFQTKVSINRLANHNAEINIIGRQKQ